MTSPIIPTPHQIIELEKKLTQKEIADIYGVNEKTVRR
jgi:DNA-binding CsgD family transcriptional regulator